jgi:hypothetical protein
MSDLNESGPQAEAPPPTFGDLTKMQRSRALARMMVRTLFTVAVLITVYAVMSPSDIADGNVGVRLVGSLLVFAGVIALQVYAITRDPLPELRAGSSMITATTLLVLMFGMTYATLASANPEWFSQPLDKSSAIYFTVTILGTVGFGDITAVSHTARWVVTAQIVVDLTLVVALGRVLFSAARAGRVRQERLASDAGRTTTNDDPTS